MRIGPARIVFWLALAVPGAMMLYDLASGRALAMDLLHPSGEMSIRLMILAMLPGPLADFFGRNRFLQGWLSIRRNFGVAAFVYALLHLVIYAADMRLLSAIIGEFELPAIWTGWLALVLMIPPAAISFNAAMRALAKRWKQVQQLVYAALVFSLVHWLLFDWHWQPALIHLALLTVAWLLRAVGRNRTRKSERVPS